jgi:hypothetical protein
MMSVSSSDRMIPATALAQLLFVFSALGEQAARSKKLNPYGFRICCTASISSAVAEVPGVDASSAYPANS